MNSSRQEEFEALVRPVMEWLMANYSPRHLVQIDGVRAELLEGSLKYGTSEFYYKHNI